MNGNEMRLGNLVALEGFGFCKIDAINSAGMKGKRLIKVISLNGLQTMRYSDNYIQGVKVTCDWLIKLGFKEVKAKSGIQAAYKIGGIRIELSNSGNFYWKNKSVRFIHTIQNIYFFNQLTGEELTIK